MKVVTANATANSNANSNANATRAADLARWEAELVEREKALEKKKCQVKNVWKKHSRERKKLLKKLKKLLEERNLYFIYKMKRMEEDEQGHHPAGVSRHMVIVVPESPYPE